MKFNNKLGYIDKRGKIVINPIFEELPSEIDSTSDFVNGLALVMLDNKLCYINKEGKIVWTEHR